MSKRSRPSWLVPLVSLSVFLALAGCGTSVPTDQRTDGGERAATPAAAQPNQPAPTAPRLAAAATCSPLLGHAAYATQSCESCHPCGAKAAHTATWTDTTSTGFHAFSANQGLAACQSCHGAALDGVGGTTTVSCAQCHGAAWKTSCTMCHGGTDNQTGAPPRTTWGNAADAVRVGTHTSHLAATHGLSVAVACSACHVVPADALAAGHVDAAGVADVKFSGLASQGTTTATWTRASSTCSNTYCHGATLQGGTKTAPVWTDATGAARACTACHGAPPPAPHTTSTACSTCHGTGYSATTVNAATHMNGVVDVTNMTCTSCHGNAAQTATPAAPLYAAPPSGTKGETATTTRAVGAHQAHLVNTTLRATAIACAECHAVPSSTSHATGTVDMTWGTLSRTGGFTPTWNGTTCTNYCHGSSLGAGGTITAPTWTAGSTQDACGTCHGVPPPAPHTTDTTCGNCHTGYTSTSVNRTLHMNGVVDATSTHPAGWSAGNQHGYQANLTGLAGCKSCHGATLAGGTGPSCTACHTTAGFATWDTNCTFCHGNRTSGRQSPPLDVQGRTVTTNTSVGRHDTHVSSTMLPAITCAACHPARSTSVVTDTAHVDGDGVAEVALKSFSYTSGSTTTTVTGAYARTSGTAATCTVYCHSNFPTSSGGARIVLSKSWVATSTSSCTSCHSTKSSRHTAGKHASYACGTCHGTGYTSTAVTGAAVASHIDGKKTIVTVATGTGIRTWNAATRTCTASCHGSQTW